MSLHVVQLGPVPPPEGGISRNIAAVRDELLVRGHSCSLVATSRSSEILEAPDVYHPRSPIELIRQVRKMRPDVVHLHIGGDLTKRVLALAATASTLAPRTVLTVHSGAYPLTDAAKRARPGSIRGRIFRRFSHVVAVNEAMADVFRRYGVADDSVSVILPFAVKPPDPDVEIPEAFQEFIASHSPFLLAVGGLEKDYDPLFQVAALKKVRGQQPNAGLMIAGDGSMRTEVENAISETDYRDHVMLAGNVEHAVTQHLIQKADAMLRTTLFDGDAISIREALFMGTPVIATDNGMRPDGVQLIGRSDLEGLAGALKTAKRQPSSGLDGRENISAILDLYER